MAIHAIRRSESSVKKKATTGKAKPAVAVVRGSDIINTIGKWDAYKKIEVIQSGVSKKQFEEVKKQTELDYETLASILSVTKATLHNKKGDAKFSSAVSERLLLLADIYVFGYEVFGDREKFNEWIEKPVRALGGKAPLEIMSTIYGMEEVKNIIGRIAYGVYS